MIKVAILTDIPMLHEKSMYLSELEEELRKKKMWVNVFVLKTSLDFLERKICSKRIARAIALKKELKKYDIIHIQFTFPLGVLYSSLKRLGVFSKPVIIHTHGYDVFMVPELNYGLRRTTVGSLIAKQAWNTASKIIAVCKEAAQQIADAGVSHENISILYNGINQELFHEQNNKASVKRNNFVFLDVASFMPVKNHLCLLKAFREVRKYYNEKNLEVNLVLVGDGPLRRKMESIAPEGVFFLGKISRDELPNIYCSSDAFILPSKSEGHPLSLLEAMSCGIPTIASSVGGIPETIQNQELLINPWNIESVIEKMMLLVEMSPEERRMLGKTNRDIVLRNFTLKMHVENLLQIYKSVS